MGEPILPARQLVALDLLRFVCAMLVVVYHYGSAFALSPGHAAHDAFAGLAPSTRLVEWTWFGWVGVELFFVISGYVIAFSARSGSACSGSAGAFLRRRVLRLAPGAWVCASITAIVLLCAGTHAHEDLARRWLASMTFNPFLPQIDGAYWSIGVEVSFYLLIALLLRFGGSGSLDRLPKGLTLMSAVYWLGRLVNGDGLGLAPPLWSVLLLLQHGGLFALGMFLECRRRTGRLPAPAFLALALGTSLLAVVDHAYERTIDMGLAGDPTLPLVVFGLGVCVIANVDRLAIKPPVARIVTLLGVATYPLYLVHQDVGAVVIAELLGNGLPYELAVGVTVAAMVAVVLSITLVAEPRVRSALVAMLRFLERRPANRVIGLTP